MLLSLKGFRGEVREILSSLDSTPRWRGKGAQTSAQAEEIIDLQVHQERAGVRETPYRFHKIKVCIEDSSDNKIQWCNITPVSSV